jgi:DDE superfamily endonuclease
VAVKWLGRFEQVSSREPVGHGGRRSSKLMPHWDFLEPARTEKPDLTLQALCDRLLVERGVNADTSMMGRFFCRLGVTFKRKTARFLDALRNEGIEAPCLFDGPINGERFRAYIEQCLVPTLKPGDVVILENLGSHKGKVVRQAVEPQERSCVPAKILV